MGKGGRGIVNVEDLSGVLENTMLTANPAPISYSWKGREDICTRKCTYFVGEGGRGSLFRMPNKL